MLILLGDIREIESTVVEVGNNKSFFLLLIYFSLSSVYCSTLSITSQYLVYKSPYSIIGTPLSFIFSFPIAFPDIKFPISLNSISSHFKLSITLEIWLDLNNLRSSIFFDCSSIFLSNNNNILPIFSCSFNEGIEINIWVSKLPLVNALVVIELCFIISFLIFGFLK